MKSSPDNLDGPVWRLRHHAADMQQARLTFMDDDGLLSNLLPPIKK
jgi:hypothetical protein